MCLYLNKGSKVLTARTDITVYKSVNKRSHNATKTFSAIFFKQTYVLGKTVEVKAFNPYTSNYFEGREFTDSLPSGIQTINRGLHSASKIERARRFHGNVTLECVIPKGTKYIRGKRNEIVSLALKPVRVVK